MKVARRSIILMLLSVAISATAGADDPDMIHIVRTRWGFDGTIQKEMFVPLSVEVQNLSPRPWQGSLRLERGLGRRERVGAILETDVALQPDESRWVQFVPYLMDDQDEWRLTWGPEKTHQVQLPPTQAGPPVTVLVYDDDDVTPSGGVLRRLPEHLFPNTLCATDGLRGLIFNQAPFWQGARAQAFLDWLSRGGRVYLLLDDHGRFPEFHSPLQILNQERAQFAVGAGQVRRIAEKVENFDLTRARRDLFHDEPAEQANADRRRQLNSFDPRAPYSNFWDRDEPVFERLAKLVEFQRSWTIIYLAVLAYLLTLFPVCYRIGRFCPDVRMFYGAFFGAVVLFSILFGMLGQLNGATRNRIETAAIAQALGNEMFDVTAWSQLAAVHAGRYTLSFPGSGVCLSTCQANEQVNGVLYGGRENRVELQMPPASTRTLLHRAKMTLKCPAPTLTTSHSEATLLQGLTISVPACYGEPVESVAIYRGGLYFLKYSSGILELDAKRPRRVLSEYLSKASRWNQTPGRIGTRPDDLDVVTYKSLLRPLLGNSYGLIQTVSNRALQQPAGVLRIAMLIPMPAEWRAETAEFQQGGVVLLVHDLHTN
jgi:hypothetical protein